MIAPGLMAARSRSTAEAQHFNVPLINSIPKATPGTIDLPKAAWLGILGQERARRISVIHLHSVADHGTGTTTIEVYRKRDGAFTLIATISQVGGSGDDQTAWLVPEGADADVIAGDYLYAQLTALQGANYRGFIDVHFRS